MAKTLEQINSEFIQEYVLKEIQEPDPKDNIDHLLSDLLNEMGISENKAGSDFIPDPNLNIQCSNISTIKLEAIKPEAKNTEAKNTEAKNTERRGLKRVSDIIFYAAIALILAAALIFNGMPGGILHLFGYSGFAVESGSMQRALPVGSLIITKSVDQKTIKKGDDITFINRKGDIVTHRVISITENFDEKGNRGFQTKGLENPLPDSEIVDAINVKGVVKFHIPGLGFTLRYISDNIGYVLLLLGGVAITAIFVRKFFSESKKTKITTAADARL